MERHLFHSTEVVWEMLAREEWLGCRHDASPMVDIPGSTPVWAQYMYFWFFLIQNLYVLCFQRSIYIMKGYWWFLTLSWLNDDQGTFLTAHDVFFIEMENPQIYRYCFFNTEIDLHICFIYSLLWFHVKFIVISIHHWAHGLLTLLLFPFYRLVVILLYRTTVVKIFSSSLFFD